MDTIVVLIIVLLILVVAAVVFMNMNANKNSEAIVEAQEKINKLKNSIAETKLKTSRNEADKVKRVKIDEEPEDDIVYLKSAAAVDVQSPDIEKNNFSIKSDENRASVMEKQNIVENDVKKNFEKSDAKIAPRVINKGPDSMNLNQKLPQITMEQMQAAKYKSRDKEKNEEVRQAISARQAFASARHAGPMPSPKLIRMGPPKMVHYIGPKNPKGMAAKHIRMGPPKMVGEIDTFGPKAERKVHGIGPKSPKGKATKPIRIGIPKMVGEIDTFGPKAERKVPEIGKRSDPSRSPIHLSDRPQQGDVLPPRGFGSLAGLTSNMPRLAVCRDIPGSSVDSCGRPSSFGPVRMATQIQGLKKT